MKLLRGSRLSAPLRRFTRRSLSEAGRATMPGARILQSRWLLRTLSHSAFHSQPPAGDPQEAPRYLCGQVGLKHEQQHPASPFSRTRFPFKYLRKDESAPAADTDLCTVYGWIRTKRTFGGLLFMVIADWTGTIQCVWEKGEAYAQEGNAAAEFEQAFGAVAESVVRVVGRTRVRPSSQIKSESLTGHVELSMTSFEVLNGCSIPVPINMLPDSSSSSSSRTSQAGSHAPAAASTNAESSDVLRLKHRYLEMRAGNDLHPHKSLQYILRLRSQIALTARNFLANKDFVEVETPVLFKSTPEGAREFVVPTRRRGQFFALPQSPQQYKQLLMVGGLDRYFQIARCFRDEDGRSDRQPEFTQIDLEVSFESAASIMSLTEDLVHSLVRACIPSALQAQSSSQMSNLICQSSFPVLSYDEAMTLYGSDKPDLRFGMKLVDVTKHVFAQLLAVAKMNAGEITPDADDVCPGLFRSLYRDALQGTARVVAINLKGLACLSRSEIAVLLKEDAQTNLHKGAEKPTPPLTIKVDASWKLPKGRWLLDGDGVTNTLGTSSRQALQRSLAAEKGDLLVLFAGRVDDSVQFRHTVRFHKLCQRAGNLRLRAANLMRKRGLEICLPQMRQFEFVWITNFPMFEEDSYGYLSAAHHPFTSPVPEDAQKLQNLLDAFEKVGEHFYSNPTQLLELRAQSYDLVCNGVEVGGGSIRIHDHDTQLRVLKLLRSNPENFSHLLTALQLGLVAIFASEPSNPDNNQWTDALRLRDVVAFPKSYGGKDVMVNSPAELTPTQLSEYSITCDDGP